VAKKKKHKKAKKISNRQAKTFPKKQKIEMVRPKSQAYFIKGIGEVKSPAHAKAFELPGEIKMSDLNQITPESLERMPKREVIHLALRLRDFGIDLYEQLNLDSSNFHDN